MNCSKYEKQTSTTVKIKKRQHKPVRQHSILGLIEELSPKKKLSAIVNTYYSLLIFENYLIFAQNNKVHQSRATNVCKDKALQTNKK